MAHAADDSNAFKLGVLNMAGTLVVWAWAFEQPRRTCYALMVLCTEALNLPARSRFNYRTAYCGECNATNRQCSVGIQSEHSSQKECDCGYYQGD
jgi:hypothetical protein